MLIFGFLLQLIASRLSDVTAGVIFIVKKKKKKLFAGRVCEKAEVNQCQ